MITVLVAGGLTLTLVLVTSYPLYFEKKIPIPPKLNGFGGAWSICESGYMVYLKTIKFWFN